MKRENANRSGSRCGRESGAILIVSLLILLGMTLIGVSSMDSAVMELKMASTMQRQVVAMNRAENTLILAETRIETLTSDGAVWNFETTSDGLYTRTDALDPAQIDWSSFNSEEGLITSDNDLDDDDSYVIEYLGVKTIPGNSIKKDTNGRIIGGAVHTFRNTTRSASGHSVVRMVQSVYVTLASP